MKTHCFVLPLISEITYGPQSILADTVKSLTFTMCWDRQISHFYYVAGPWSTVPPSYMVYGPAELDTKLYKRVCIPEANVNLN
jgi:hypothetical protein